MSPLDALVCDNWFCDNQVLRLRKGAQEHATGFGATVESLLPYNKYDGATVLFAATASGIYNATAAGAIGAAVAAKTSGRWVHRNYSNGATTYLLLANGTDAYTTYDGTTWATPAISGSITNSATINFVEVYRERLFFLVNGSLDLHYLATGSVSGATTSFPMGRYFKRGGYAVALGTWTIDSGAGPDDRLVMITSQGEIAVFRGSNPSVVADWVLDGIYYVGAPLGNRCLAKYGGDLLALTEEGIWPLSRLLQSSTLYRQFAISDKIDPVLGTLSTEWRSTWGWQLIVNPLESQLWVLVPSTPRVIYVMNTQSRAWSRYTGWDSRCATHVNGQWYYGDTSRVVKASIGAADFGANISARALTAFNYFQSPGVNKKFNMLRPILLADGAYDLSIGGTVDYSSETTSNPVAATPVVASVWDTALWDSGVWGGDPVPTKDWRTLSVPMGFALATYCQVASRVASVQWVSTDYIYQRGSPL